MGTSELLLRLSTVAPAAALFLDVDGTLAPIVKRPAEASVPAATRDELRRLHRRYALVACVSGRTREDARRVVGVPELTYVGEHGLDLVPAALEWAPRIAAFAAGVPRKAELKPLTASFHYRQDADQDAAVRELEAVAQQARAEGLEPRWGRKVLEIRPPLTAGKGTAVRALLAQEGVRAALYAGDDTTDLDGFAALAGLELSVRVAVLSDEGPAQLAASADVTVAGPDELLRLLRAL